MVKMALLMALKGSNFLHKSFFFEAEAHLIEF